MKTCDECKHDTFADDDGLPIHQYEGNCALMEYGAPISINKAIPWDYEGHSGAEVSVGPKFGCIHWEKKDAAQ